MSRSTFTVGEIAERFGVAPETVSHWITAGELAGINVSRSRNSKKPRWRITQTALEAFESSRAATPPPVSAPRSRRKKSSGVIEFYK